MVRLAGAVPYRNVYGHDVKAKSASLDMYKSVVMKYKYNERYKWYI